MPERCINHTSVTQTVLIKMAGWVTSMSFEASTRVGDFGTLYATDAIIKINPCIVDGPNVWKETSQIQWKLTGNVKDPKLSFPLAFRSVKILLSGIQGALGIVTILNLVF